MAVSKWIHKGCGGEVRTHTIDERNSVAVVAKCEKCGKEWVLGRATMFMGIPLMMPNPDPPEDIEIVRGRGEEGIELRIYAYEDVIEGCVWDGELIVNGKEYDIDVLWDLLGDPVIKRRVTELLEERDGDEGQEG